MKKKLAALVAVLIATTILFAACNGQNPMSGNWTSPHLAIEFAADDSGTLGVRPNTGSPWEEWDMTWHIADGRLHIADEWDLAVFEYELDGDTLTITGIYGRLASWYTNHAEAGTITVLNR
ncbi:MAG: hypothetical protein FWC93_07900 [Defluviitaleaceae bacterium]|nr:hypothetical protein [Defluviitaleaceae bacterium]